MLRKLDKLTSKLYHRHRQETLTFNQSVFRKFQLSLVRCSRLGYRKPVFTEHAFFYLIIVKFKYMLSYLVKYYFTHNIFNGI